MKKLLLGALLLLSMVGFSQESKYAKVIIVHTTANLTGLEDIASLGKYEVGGGLVNHNQDFYLYGIGCKQITNDLSLGGKVGGAQLDKEYGLHIYYGIVSYLQVFGGKTGLIISFGYDNTNNCTYGVGYKF